ncbi:hypothetical protein N9C32_00790 [Flavobacteriaceae bacterium]|nr:hypothetical protein [Flavobacteriaceae bacterium]MDA7741298.1 hypothetical protein [Flavobacteriaceae bacterium]MDA9276086.1 hypothetical protein [Flavobacteriaceae bacterium]MDA9817695.1 hypothetical protein [Flavobacteriaceae bacterium]MDA9850612.1 hypothetical protein [Flavobacteriaceae bacterium]
MKNKILLLALILTFSSCGIFISVTDTGSTVTEIQVETSFDEVTKFIGKYDITVFGLPDVGELGLIMNVTRDGDELKTEIEEGEQESGLDVLKTEIEEDILYIDLYVDSYGINVSFEIYVDGNTVTGYLADMFELEGTITY